MCYLGNVDDHLDADGSIVDGRGTDSGAAGRDPHRVGQLPAARSVKFAPANALLAACHQDSVRLWDLAEPADARLLGTIASIKNAEAAFFSDDGTELSVLFREMNSRHVVQLWDIAEPTSPRPIGEPLRRDETPHVTPPGAVQVDARRRRRAWNLSAPSPLGLRSTFSYQRRALTEAAEVSTVLVADLTTIVELWDITNPTAPSLLSWLGDPYGDSYEVTGVSLSPDSRILAVGRIEEEMPARCDLSVHLWDVSEPATARPLAMLSEADFPLKFSPDSAMLAVMSRLGVQVWDLTDPLSPRRHGGFCDIEYRAGMDFSADGVILAAASRRQGEPVTLWKVR